MAIALRCWTLRPLESARSLLCGGDRKRSNFPLCLSHVQKVLDGRRRGSSAVPISAASATAADQRCFFSTSSTADRQLEKPKQQQPSTHHHLMDFPRIMWPSLFHSFKNYILSMLIIKPSIDRDFSLDEFMRGAKQAITHVSHAISEEKLDNLNGLVTEEAIQEIKTNLERFSEQQRKELYVQDEDFFFGFPYQVGLLFDDATETTPIPTRYVEITVCFHCFPGFKEMKKRDPTMREMIENRDKVIVCNYRFIREYAKSMHGNWTINKLNHFKPSNL